MREAFIRNLTARCLSGIRESNSRLNLGKVAYCHYTNPAFSISFLNYEEPSLSFVPYLSFQAAPS